MAVQQDVDDAVVAATAAFRAWSRLQHAERRKLLIEFSDRLETHKSDLTKLLSKETGKTVEKPKFPTILPCNRDTNGCMQTEFAESEVVMGINTIRGNGEFTSILGNQHLCVNRGLCINLIYLQLNGLPRSRSSKKTKM